MSSNERSIFVAGMVLRLSDDIKKLSPPDSQFMIPRNLKDKLEQSVMAVITSPNIDAYVTAQLATQRVMRMLAQHPEWGFTADVANDRHKSDTVKRAVDNRLTDRRSVIKGLIAKSAGLAVDKKTGLGVADRDIISLCRAINGLMKGYNATITLPMCARVAFLRNLYVTSVDNRGDGYWSFVDESLLSLRNMFGQKVDGAKQITATFMNILEEDLKTYGGRDLVDGVSATLANAPEIQQLGDLAAMC
ncbi:hypothetical protein BXZ70DRAFT_939069, partial [Cristinia sonorae]